MVFHLSPGTFLFLNLFRIASSSSSENGPFLIGSTMSVIWIDWSLITETFPSRFAKYYFLNLTLHKKWNFPEEIFNGKLHFFVQCEACKDCLRSIISLMVCQAKTDYLFSAASCMESICRSMYFCCSLSYASPNSWRTFMYLMMLVPQGVLLLDFAICDLQLICPNYLK